MPLLHLDAMTSEGRSIADELTAPNGVPRASDTLCVLRLHRVLVEGEDVFQLRFAAHEPEYVAMAVAPARPCHALLIGRGEP